MVVDTTVWVDYLNGIINPKTDHLHRAILQDEPVLHSDKDFTNIAKHTSMKEVELP